MSISDTNYDNLDNVKIKDYTVEQNYLGIGYNISRQIILMHNTSEYTKKYDLESKYLAAVIIIVKLAPKKM